MILRREGMLQQSELGTGDILSLELKRSDIDNLLDHSYTMTRFVTMGGDVRFMQNCQGWAQDDKIHVVLRDTSLEHIDVPFSLSLDPGGDLWFDIFDDAAKMANSCERYEIDKVLLSDPSSTLRGLGVTAVGMYHLNAIDEVRQQRVNDAILRDYR